MAGGKGGDGDIPPEMATAAAKLEDDWDSLHNKEKAQSIVDICTTGKSRADLPQDEKKARIAVGKILMSNMDASALEMLELVIKEFGVSSAKEEAKAKQKSAMAGSCRVAANAGIVQAFQELGDYYFKEGNANAGLTVSIRVACVVEGIGPVCCLGFSYLIPFVCSTKKQLPPSLGWTTRLQQTMPRALERARPNLLALAKAQQTRCTSFAPLVRIRRPHVNSLSSIFYGESDAPFFFPLSMKVPSKSSKRNVHFILRDIGSCFRMIPIAIFHDRCLESQIFELFP